MNENKASDGRQDEESARLEEMGIHRVRLEVNGITDPRADIGRIRERVRLTLNPFNLRATRSSNAGTTETTRPG